MGQLRAIVVTGVSGSGKTGAIRALEDIGFFCIDNLPVPLLETFLLLCRRDEEIGRVAFVMDVREKRFAEAHAEAFEKARAMGVNVDIVFLDADDATLIGRYNETRRNHPLAEGITIGEALLVERQMLSSLRGQASLVLNTTQLNVHELKKRVQDFAQARQDPGRMHVSVMSFGFKYGLPSEAHYVLDVRFIPNPYFDEKLRPLDGRSEPVRQFLRKLDEVHEMEAHAGRLLDFVVPLNEREGKARLALAVGCTGGRHRSVYFAERIREKLEADGYVVTVIHRDLERG